MSKIGIIIQREYTSRVMKKSFLLLTFITPLFFTLTLLVPVWLATLKDNTIKNIVVIDKTHQYHHVLKSNEQYTFVFTDKNLDDVRNEKKIEKKSNNNELAAVLYIKDDLSKDVNGATLYSEKQVNLELKTYITNILNNYVRDQKLASFNIPNLKEKIEQSKTDIELDTIKWSPTGEEQKGSAELAIILGMLSAFLIYIFIMTYGSQVLMGVVQEKTSRIVEVLISSVKPFELMMGKIIGIALVGLTQFILWILLTLIITGVAGFVLGINLHPESMQMGHQAVASGDMNSMVAKVFTMLSGFDLIKTLVLFILYFLGGYLLYASFFAAVGSAVDHDTDMQQFTAPLTIPIVFAIFVAIYGAQNPDGPLAFWCSLIPFTSPIVMMVRLPYDVPSWQIILSLGILILTFIASTWMAGKIYRTGILMYGKKVTWKELWKWVRHQ